jgi:hypothetical protein
VLVQGACATPIAGPRHFGAVPTSLADALIIGFGAQPSCSASDLDGVENDITAPLGEKKRKIARTLHGNAQGNRKYG